MKNNATIKVKQKKISELESKASSQEDEIRGLKERVEQLEKAKSLMVKPDQL